MKPPTKEHIKRFNKKYAICQSSGMNLDYFAGIRQLSLWFWILFLPLG